MKSLLQGEYWARAVWGLLLLFVGFQIWFTMSTRHLRSVIEEVPPAPTEQALKAMALGDDEFLFRYLGRWLQFIGDGGGRMKPLYQYDYDRVVNWAQALDQLDENRSDYIHELAATYFGEITKAVDPQSVRLRKIIGYIRLSALSDPAHRWKWLVWAAHKARNPVGDPALLESVARDLQSPELEAEGVPAWVRVLPIQLYRDAGDRAAAEDALARIRPEDRKEVEDMRRKLQELLKAHRSEPGLPDPQAKPH